MYSCKYDNSWINVSDRRLKNVGENFKGGLAELKKLDLFHYTYKSDKEKTPHVGVMSQDLQKVFP
ncbi:MAG: tail fiber domain-containing protein, partial [Phascolarctobacterium sp.]|nr:tail fiber domain-containing protein [Phascolarctobacterium sp.]